ncbi:anion exchange protein 2 isoform X2 [Plutella xylostella]|uniref:anion exchange protein 2 isoform X2 n=1 Tax=Plutella xylostella TaxID=51655 RepID=UPI002032BEB5|nr:anion exchange protein 2 isoform X2 [Plutella xylostella]
MDDALGPLGREKLRKFSLQETRSPRVPPPAPPLGAAVSNRSVNNNNNNNPHSVFVQLDELLGEEDEAAWTQTARWIKYEQDVEAAGRWGRPHVAPLSFHSLLNLRRCLEQGVVLLDLEEKDLPGIATRVTEKMVSEGLIEADDQQLVISCLLKRHKHVHDGGFRFSISGRKLSSYTSLQSLVDRRRRSSAATTAAAAAAVQGSRDSLRPAHNEGLMRRIPAGAEATTVLVGAVGFLQQPTIAFVRLAAGLHLPGITEVPVPVRFMFVLLGPTAADLDYHEVGRSISTLMSNPTFHGIAYRAEDRSELLSAVNEFLDDSLVLPPGDWERQELLPVEELRAKSERIRQRRRAAAAAAPPPPPAAPPADAEKAALLEAEGAKPPPDEPQDPLQGTGRPFGAMLRDMRRRYPHYLSDLREGLTGQCLAAAIFMYFAALSSAVTFGGLLAQKTGGQIGVPETLLFTAVGGVVFALAAGQPLMITGATGPLLLLDEALAAFCASQGFDLLTARCYCGLWMLLIGLTVAAVEGSRAVKLISRFTEDIFALLISVIFISEPITNIINVYRAHPLGPSYCHLCNQTENGTDYGTNTTTIAPEIPVGPQPNTALWSTILTLATFTIAYYLRIFRNGKFLGRSARRALGDFGVPIAIVICVAASVQVPVYTALLRVPSGLSPTAPRPWLVPMSEEFNSVPLWAAAAMLLPAMMIYIVVFLETHIAELIVSKPERRLQKSGGLHLDIVVLSVINCVCGVFGAPWQCVATVRSVSHVAALTAMSTTHAPGDKPHVIYVAEQRVTGLVVSLLVGLSALAGGVLRLVPLSVLFGVFLYMGISALAGIQLWERTILMLKPPKHHPPVVYVRRVPTLRMHLYTAVQILVLIGLCAVKWSSIGLALPLCLLLTVPLRRALTPLFTPLQLRALDGAHPEKLDDEPDFYQEAPLPG